MIRSAAVVSAVCLCLLGGCRRDAEPSRSPRVATPVVRELASPAAPGSLAPSLFAAPDGRVLLSWVEPLADGSHALRFANRAKGDSWSAALTVGEGRGWFVNWADFPRMSALPDGTLFAHWLEKRPHASSYDYDVRVSRSHDAGRSWDAAFRPYREAAPGEHGFVAFAPLDTERMGILFLDGRLAQREDGPTQLRFAAVSRQAQPEADSLVDERVCDCCQTALARTSRGLVAAYRDRSGAEVRDVAVVRFENGRWSPPRFPGAEGWQIRACPVNGPALAAAGDRVALAWFTMAEDTAQVKLAFSRDAGASWGPPQVVDDGHPIGRVDVALTDAGAAVVSWLEDVGQGASVRLRRVDEGAATSASFPLAGTSLARSSGFPRIVAAGGELVAAWRDASEPARIRSAIVELP